jgi:hypothetical protein
MTFVAGEVSDRCPGCGAAQAEADDRVQRRIAKFGEDLVRLQERLEFAHAESIAVRGDRLSEAAYRDWLADEMLEDVIAWADELGPLMAAGDFNEPASPDTQSAWTALLELVNRIIDTALAAKRHPGPALYLATHHSVINGLLLFASGAVGFLTTLTAPTLFVAQRRMHDAQEVLDEGGAALGRAGRLLTADAEIDSPSGRGAAAIFTELTELAERDPVMSRPLLPMTQLSRRTHDAERRTRRAEAAIAVLGRGSGANGQWLEPFDPFFESCGAAWRNR